MRRNVVTVVLVLALAMVVLIARVSLGLSAYALACALGVPLFLFLIDLRLKRGWRSITECILVFPTDLLKALLPISLPLFVVLAYASQIFSTSVELTIGLLIGVLISAALIYDGEGWREIWNALKFWRKGLSPFHQTLAFLATAVIVGGPILVGLLAIVGVTDVKEVGGTSAVLELVALLYVSFALVCRMIALCGAFRARWILLLLLGGVVAAALLSWGHGSLEGVDAVSKDRDEERRELLALVALLVAWSVVEAVVRLRRSKAEEAAAAAATQPAWAMNARRTGLLCAAVASAVLVVAFGFALADARGDPVVAQAKAEAASRTPGDMDGPTLSRVFSPALVFADSEHYWPESTKRFVEATQLRRRGQVDPSWDGTTLPSTCPDGTASSCLVLSCPEEDHFCTSKLELSGLPGAQVYARVLRIDKPDDPLQPDKPRKDRRFFAGASPFSELTIMIQYWLFYPHDRWEAITPVGRLVQEHSGDWETILVGLSAKEPLFAAFSAHCGGRWHDWRDVHGAVHPDEPASAGRRTHVLAAVAAGSHANYAESWSGRPPDWGSCRNVQAEAIWALSYASNVRDVTETNDPVPVTVLDAPADMAALHFAGHWGDTDITQLEVRGRVREIARGIGPESPALKQIWRRPVATIFCGPVWNGPEYWSKKKHESCK